MWALPSACCMTASHHHSTAIQGICASAGQGGAPHLGLWSHRGGSWGRLLLLQVEAEGGARVTATSWCASACELGMPSLLMSCIALSSACATCLSQRACLASACRPESWKTKFAAPARMERHLEDLLWVSAVTDQQTVAVMRHVHACRR